MKSEESKRRHCYQEWSGEGHGVQKRSDFNNYKNGVAKKEIYPKFNSQVIETCAQVQTFYALATGDVILKSVF